MSSQSSASRESMTSFCSALNIYQLESHNVADVRLKAKPRLQPHRAAGGLLIDSSALVMLSAQTGADVGSQTEGKAVHHQPIGSLVMLHSELITLRTPADRLSWTQTLLSSCWDMKVLTDKQAVYNEGGEPAERSVALPRLLSGGEEERKRADGIGEEGSGKESSRKK
ncbi:hypothetical protein EYF80_006480 [Liparis tanakae]|uniref:Uncharacterized protein n=1 Tax=Liparis tanakae TaxID=230148 RepID=A0A4Z2IZW1_9TELE|nr:hypothetical protein EYF80_006480 [Liparis tanakae]